MANFESFELGRAALLKLVTGEDTGILHLHLKNRTTLDLPVSDEQLQHLLRVLIHAFPTTALDEIKQQPWAKAHLKQTDE